jgi:hypothetical protein
MGKLASRPRRRLPVVAGAALLAALSAAPAVGAGAAYELDKNFTVTVDSETIEGARVFRGRRAGTLLLVVPDESKRFLLDAQAGAVFALREEDSLVSADGATAKVREHFAWSVPLSRDRDSRSFLLGSSLVTVTRAEPKTEARAAESAPSSPAATTPASPATEPPAVATPRRETAERTAAAAPHDGPARRSGGSAPPGAGAASGAGERKEARACVSLETRPANGVPGCTRFVFLRNTCDAAVVAQLQRTEHLMTGSLPQLFSDVVPGGSELALGCSWWSGAMAPAQHQIVGASYLAPDDAAQSAAPGAPAH